MRTLEDILGDGYKIVNRGPNDEFFTVQPTKLVEPASDEDPEELPEPLKQLSPGYGAETRYRELTLRDYNPAFAHDTKVLYETIREMRNDAQVRNSLRYAKSPVVGARWFIKPASEEQFDVDVADFIWRNLTEWMSTSFYHLMVESLLMLDYGWYIFEKVFDFIPDPRTGEPRVVWRRFVPVHPMDVLEPIYNEKDGGPEGIQLEDENETKIDISKLLVFTFDKEGGNMQGNSILRSAYKHYFYKDTLYSIDAIQKERHGVGVPIIKLPPNAGRNDRTLAHTIGMNLRSNERAHVVVPTLWEIEFAKLEGQRVDSLESAKHHGDMIYENVMGKQDDDGEMFLKSTRFTAEIIKDVWNKYGIPQLCRWNWPEFPNGFPEIDVRRLGDTTDWRMMSFAMRNFVGMHALTPDDALEKWVREEMDLPNQDPSTAREMPGAGGNQVPGSTSPSARIGLPKQTPQANVAAGVGSAGRVNRDVGGK